MTYVAPRVFAKKFTCPHCGVLSNQHWHFATWGLDVTCSHSSGPIRTGHCDCCDRNSLWLDDKMVYPQVGTSPQMNPDLPPEVRLLYEEAAAISTRSPRSAAALLRLALQVLCCKLDKPGLNISEYIADLVEAGLPPRLEQALDIVRVTGKCSVYPGQIDTDGPDVVYELFKLINIIAEYMITMPVSIQSVFDDLPEEALQGLDRRDGDI